jgi:hypothetical protein
MAPLPAFASWLAKHERGRLACLQSKQQFNNMILLSLNGFERIA